MTVANGVPCLCECKGLPKGGRYLPGHDRAHTARLVAEVLDGRSEESALAEIGPYPKLGTKFLADLEKAGRRADRRLR